MGVFVRSLDLLYVHVLRRQDDGAYGQLLDGEVSNFVCNGNAESECEYHVVSRANNARSRFQGMLSDSRIKQPPSRYRGWRAQSVASARLSATNATWVYNMQRGRLYNIESLPAK